MTTATLLQKREALRNYYQQGIKPVDGRQPIPEELAQQMVKNLKDSGVSSDALIGVHDTFLTLTLTLQEHGFSNIVVLESEHSNLTSAQKKYYNTIEQGCEKIGIKYYVPPMNNYGRCDMKFDVIIGNPPYQNDKVSGNKRGSGYKALWYEFAKQSINMLKDGGIISFITPESAFSGSDKFTSLLSGKDTKVDLDYVEFNLKSQFKGINQDICRWIARKSYTLGHLTEVNGQRIDAKNVFKVYKDSTVQNIINILTSYDGDKLSFSVSGQYNFAGVRSFLKKTGQNLELANDLTDQPTDSHQYKLIDNGKVKYTSVKYGSDYNKPRVFVSRMKNPYVVDVDDAAYNTESTLVMYFDTIEEAQKVADILNSDIARKIIMTMCSNGRISGGDISQLPSVPFEEVLTADQLSYIQSQL